MTLGHGHYLKLLKADKYVKKLQFYTLHGVIKFKVNLYATMQSDAGQLSDIPT